MKVVGNVLLYIIVLYIIINFIIPMKFAILKEDIDKERSYIVIEFVGATDEYWNIIDYSDDLKDLINKNPEILTKTLIDDMDIKNSVEDFYFEFCIPSYNKFVCYGKYTDTRRISEDLCFYMYDLEDWDILYPIKRTYSFLPKSYLCNADFKGLLFIII